YASLGQYTLTGTIQNAAGSPPVAVASATPTSGTSPLAVNFSSAGSSDSDGSIVAYDWDFGDGGTSTAANPSHTYNAAGTYTATLVVTDNLGAKATNSLVVTVSANPNNVVFVSNIVMSLVPMPSGNAARAVVTILDAFGNARPGATVSGTWSGLASGT